MTFALPALPYSQDALAPHLSPETLELHHGKHHAAYLAKLNAAVEQDSSLAGRSLEDLVVSTSGGVFNNAAQAYNHGFYWSCLAPAGGGEPSGPVAAAIAQSFGSFAELKSRLSALAAGHFGSGWAWLVKEQSGRLAVVDTHDAGNPLTEGKTPILTCGLWEHAYYVDYRNARPRYIEAWWELVDWGFANARLRG